jgi:hypothetical protein
MNNGKAVEYVELDIPVCQNTYGVLPCHARLATVGDPVVATFDGTDDYLTRGAGLTGAADSKLWTVSVWFRIADGDSGRRLVCTASTVGGAGSGIFLTIDEDNRFTAIAYNNAAAAKILDIRSSILITGRMYHALVSVDLANTSKRHLYIDDVSDLAQINTYTNDTIDFTKSDWSIGGEPNGDLLFDGEIGELWCAPVVYLDFSVESNRRKFIDASRVPVSLGADGSTPTGTAPLVFLSGAIATWHTNKGSGGGFTVHGALTEGLFASGTAKCFNSRATCQSISDLNTDDVTLRFAKPTEHLPRDIDALPFVAGTDFTSAVVSLGVDLGQRAMFKVSFKEAPHSDAGPGLDPYHAERGYDPFSRGTFWARFRARQPYLRGAALRWIHGFAGDALADMETRHFYVDSFTGPGADGRYTLIAKDILKSLDGDRAQAPLLSNGFLVADLAAGVTTAVLSPAGIGNSEYPLSGRVCIGGNEVCSFTRIDDTLTLFRGLSGTEDVDHTAQDRVQVCLRYDAESAADIIYDLMVTYGGIPASHITLAEWQAELTAYNNRVYSRTITEPRPVRALVSELIEQSALAIWDDNKNQKIRLQVLRGIPTTADRFSEENIEHGSFSIEDQPDKRLSKVWVYYGQIDSTKSSTDPENYRSSVEVIDEESETAYGAAIKVIYCPWIPATGGRTIAERLGAIVLGRFKVPPRKVGFTLMRGAVDEPDLGNGYLGEWWCIQDATGAREDFPMQVVRLTPSAAQWALEAEEMRFDAPAEDLTARNITIDFDQASINLRTIHDSLFPALTGSETVTFTILSGVTISAASTGVPAIDVGSWPGMSITLINGGRIQGAAGVGGFGGGVFPAPGSGGPGGAGGTALYTRVSLTLENNGTIWGGGGGGGGGGVGSGGIGGGGGGGAGNLPGGGGAGGPAFDIYPAGSPGSFGTTEAGGAGGAGSGNGGAGGAGGGPGIDGAAGVTGGVSGIPGEAGGTKGSSIDGISFVFFAAVGDLRGSQVN